MVEMELRMSARERDRFEVLSRVRRDAMSLREAASELNLSYRQAKRCWARFKASGEGGLVHKARGRVSNNRTPEAVREKVLKLVGERYSDFGPTLACEKLLELHDLALHPDTLVSILKEAGRYEPRRRRGRHRKRRRRRASFGSMLQMDGSHHDWFEGRAGRCVLMVLVDDATGLTFARLYASEDLSAAFDAFGRWCRLYGVPRSVYVDRHSLYWNAEGVLTQFGRAMKELAANLICARSPQAKGRVERKHRSFQDRFVKELRVRKIRSMSQANDLLEGVFLKKLNDAQAISARSQTDLHRQLPAGLKLGEVLCVAERRRVGEDWCVRWRNRWLQIEQDESALALAGKWVEVRETSVGELLLSYEGRRLRWSAADRRPRKPKVFINNRQPGPGADHPWQRAACGVR